jgi:hypothetical protein
MNADSAAIAMALHVTMLLLSFVTVKVNSSANALQASIACSITTEHDETLVPVLEGYSCAITLAKAMVDLGVSASGLVYPSAHPKKIRRKKLF